MESKSCRSHRTRSSIYETYLHIHSSHLAASGPFDPGFDSAESTSLIFADIEANLKEENESKAITNKLEYIIADVR